MIHKFVSYIQSSLDNFTIGASAKKLTALLLSLMVAYLHLRYAGHGNAVEFLIADLTAICTLLGVSTIERFKRKTKPNDESTGSEELQRAVRE
jgi:hypothetical protein